MLSDNAAMCKKLGILLHEINISSAIVKHNYIFFLKDKSAINVLRHGSSVMAVRDMCPITRQVCHWILTTFGLLSDSR